MQQGHAHERPRPVVLLFGPKDELVAANSREIESEIEYRKHDEEEFVVRRGHAARGLLREERFVREGLDARRE